jgi:hypothetical protein
MGLGITALAIAIVAPSASAASAKTKRLSLRSNGARAMGGPRRILSTSSSGRYVGLR